MNVTLRRALSTCVLAGSLALALAAGAGLAEAKTSVVGPGESIQKAVNAAQPGDTIVVKGVHKEDVVIPKNGIKLRGEDAMIEAPTGAKADSPCSKSFGTEAICVFGDVNIENGELTGPRISDVSVSGFKFRGFNVAGKGGNQTFVIDFYGARNATIVGNRIIGNVAGGIAVGKSVNSTVAKNHVIGSSETKAGAIHIANGDRNTTVVKNVIRSIPEGVSALEVEDNSINTTVAENELIGTFLGVYVENTTGTKILSNDVSRFGIVGIFMVGPKQADNDAKVVGNHISGGPWGIFVENAHGGSFTGNDVHDNCAGMFFEAFKDEPVGGFEVNGNTLADNTRSCQGTFGRNFSGIGIALLGASGMEVSANHIWGNVSSGPTPISGGVVVSKDPYFQDTNFGGKQKPNNNSVVANHFGRNKPDIFYDGSGSGNRFVGNLCDTSVPSRLCD